MSVFQAFILGLVQGLAEFLPISSSGHLMLLEGWFGLPENMLTFNVILHFGTLLAVLAVYGKRIINMFRHPFHGDFPLLCVATIPTVIAALAFDFDEVFNGKFLAVSFFLTSAVLIAADVFRKRTNVRVRDVGMKQAIVMGIMQVLAILPGFSRSGATISGGIFSGLSRKRAADFAFFMTFPAICGSFILEGYKLFEGESSFDVPTLQLAVAFVAATVAGYFAIRLMLKFIRKVPLSYFAIYTALVGVLALITR